MQARFPPVCLLSAVCRSCACSCSCSDGRCCERGRDERESERGLLSMDWRWLQTRVPASQPQPRHNRTGASKRITVTEVSAAFPRASHLLSLDIHIHPAAAAAAADDACTCAPRSTAPAHRPPPTAHRPPPASTPLQAHARARAATVAGTAPFPCHRRADYIEAFGSLYGRL